MKNFPNESYFLINIYKISSRKRSTFPHLHLNIDKIENSPDISSKRPPFPDSEDSPIKEDNEEEGEDREGKGRRGREEEKRRTPRLTPKNSFVLKRVDEVDEGWGRMERRIEELVSEIIIEENEEIEKHSMVLDRGRAIIYRVIFVSIIYF
jgi:hypothetical protein